MKYLSIIFLLSFSFLAVTSMVHASVNSIIITEIMYDPIDSDPSHEWIELYNPTVENIEMDNWEISDLNSSPHYENFSGIIKSGEYFIIGRSLVIEADYVFSFDLNNAGEGLFLRNGDGEIMDEVYWKENGWTLNSGPANSGDTICRISTENIGDESEWDTCSSTIKSGDYIIQENDEEENKSDSGDSSRSKKTQSVVFGCKDKTAKNYNRFVFHRDSFCDYGDGAENTMEISKKENLYKSIEYFFIANTRVTMKIIYNPIIRIDKILKNKPFKEIQVKKNNYSNLSKREVYYKKDIMCLFSMSYCKLDTRFKM